MEQMFGFETALQLLKAGGEVTRAAWGKYGNHIRLAHIEVDSHRKVPQFILIDTRGRENPWAPAIHDMLSEDWVVSKFPPAVQLPENVHPIRAPRGPNLHRRKTDTEDLT